MAANAGRKIVDETVRLNQEAESGIYTHAVADPGQGGAMTSSFPRGGLQARDKRDEIISEKAQYMDAGGMTKFGQVVATDADFEWLRKKRETEAFANLDAWIGKNFHKADPATRRWLQETYPEYYESRERIMTDRAKLALRIQLLKLRGPKNEKDLMLQWALQTGRIKLDRDWDRIGPSSNDQNLPGDAEQKRYKDGLFSFRRFLADSERRANQDRSFDPNGTPNPFKPNDATAYDQGQVSSPFPGYAVPDTRDRYPSFLTNVLQPYL